MAPDGGSKTYHTHDDNTTSKELYTHTFNTILQLLSPKSGHIVGSIFSQYKNFHKNSKIKAHLVLYVKYYIFVHVFQKRVNSFHQYFMSKELFKNYGLKNE